MNRTSLVICFLVFNGVAIAQSSAGLEATPYFSSLIVEDLEVSQSWYQEIFNLVEENKFESEERGIKQVNLSGDGKWFELIELEQAKKPQESIDGYTARTRLIGFFKIGFQVAHFDQTLEYLKELQVDFYGEVVNDPNTGKRMIIVNDPDGNRVQFFER